MMDATALKRALQAKFGPPGRTSKRRILKQLGLDEDLDAPAAFGGGNTDALKKMRVDIENLLGELDLDEKQVGKILALLDKHAPFDRLDDNDPNAERARELAGQAGDTEGGTREKFRELLRQAGLSDRDIDKAFEIATSAAKDAKKARDDALGLPKPAPAGFGGRLGMDAAGALEAIRGTNADWAQAIRRDDLDLGVLGGALERISQRRTVSPGVLDRLAMDSAADAALRQAQGVERHHDNFDRRYPEVARVY